MRKQVHTWTCRHTCRHAERRCTGQPIRPPHVPGRPLYRALMGCGIDVPSVTVSRWITVSGRETQKREEEARSREARGERRRRRGRLRDQTHSSSKRGSLCLSLRDSSLSWKKRLNPQHPPPPTPHPGKKVPSLLSPSQSSLCCPSLSLSLSLC